jgi:hypothetical protein
VAKIGGSGRSPARGRSRLRAAGLGGRFAARARAWRVAVEAEHPVGRHRGQIQGPGDRLDAHRPPPGTRPENRARATGRGLSSGLIHPRPRSFISVHGGRVCTRDGRWRTLVNAGQHCWKACWGQPLASSNLASSATSDQAIHKPRSYVRLGLARAAQSHLQSHSFYAYRYKTYQGCRRTLLSAIAVVAPIGRTALSDQLAARAVTIGERLSSDDARCSTPGPLRCLITDCYLLPDAPAALFLPAGHVPGSGRPRPGRRTGIGPLVPGRDAPRDGKMGL